MASWLSLGALRIVGFAITAMPGWAFREIARAAVWGAMILNSRDVCRARDNLRRTLLARESPEEIDKFLRQTLHLQIMALWASLGALFHKKRLTILGRDQVQRVLREAQAATPILEDTHTRATGARPVIFVTAHLGSWEVAASEAQRAVDGNFLILARRPRSRVLADALRWARARLGVRLLWNDQASLLRPMTEALHRGTSLGFAMDQKPEGRKGPTVPFLGLPTPFVGGPAAMAVRHGVPVIAIYAIYRGNRTFEVGAEIIYRGTATESAKPPSGTATEVRRAAELELTSQIARSFERQIRSTPEQWTWSYKRWADPVPAD